MIYQGSCHCGRIAFLAEGEIGSLLECNCSICAKRGSLLWFIPCDRFALQTAAENVSTYTFNKHRIKHHFCAVCGCAPYAEASDDKGNPMAAVNARCLDDIELAAFTRVPFDGKSL
jgi:hypothetical protein